MTGSVEMLWSELRLIFKTSSMTPDCFYVFKSYLNLYVGSFWARTSLSEPYERHVFRNLKQEEGETVDQFITRLRHQAENCNRANADEPIRDQVIDKCSSADLRGKLLLKGTHLTLEKVQEIARSFEAVDIQLKAMTSVEEDRQQVNLDEQEETADLFKGKEAKARCYRCDREGHFSRDSCCPTGNAELV